MTDWQRTTSNEQLSSEFPHQLGLRKDVALHRLLYVLAAGAGLEIQHCIQCVQPEEVAVRPAGRRTGSTVADVAEVVASLLAAAWQFVHAAHRFGKFLRLGRQVVKHPMCEGPAR